MLFLKILRIDPEEAKSTLTEGELKLLMDHEFEDKALTFTRDVFVFSAFTGLAFIDLKELKYENIVDINGSKWIVS